MSTIWNTLRRHLAALRAAREGNVAIMFAIAIIPIIGAVGFAVDFTRANAIKAAMGSALDSTALMLSKNAATLSQGDLQTLANSYFKALFNQPDATNINISATYATGSGSSLTVKGSADVATTFLAVLGYNDLTVNGSSTTKWGSSRLRVALVLDNTGSMASAGKMDALKTATKNLLTQLKNATQTDGDVYVSIVPFVKDVNLGASNYNASWIDWTDWNSENGVCYNNAQYNGTPTSYTTQSNCTGHGKYWLVANHSTWNGCVMDRGGKNGPTGQNYDTNVSLPDIGNPATLFPAEQYSACPQQVKGLSYDWSAMNTLVNGMSPNGNTNQAIGLAHGWMSLAGGGPFTVPATDPNYTYSQVIILLTDGLNTQDRWYSNQASIDARQQLTCDNIKAAGITLYMIQVNTGGDPKSTLLQNCASSSDKFFLLTSANQIVTTFSTIGTNLTKLRIAQ